MPPQSDEGCTQLTIIMAEYSDASVVKALTISDIDKMKNAQLKQALSALINEPRDEEPSNRILLEELRSLRVAAAEVASLNQEKFRL